MNNVDCSGIPGRWTRALPPSPPPPPPFMCSPSFIHSSFLLWLYVSSRSSLPLSAFSSSLVFYLFSVSPSSILTFHYVSVLLPVLLSLSLSPSLSLSLPDPLLSASLFCSSVKALRNYSHWFPGLGLRWVLGWFVRSTKVSVGGCCCCCCCCCCECISPHYLLHTSMLENCLPPWPGEITALHRHQTLKCVCVWHVAQTSPNKTQFLNELMSETGSSGWEVAVLFCVTLSGSVRKEFWSANCRINDSNFGSSYCFTAFTSLFFWDIRYINAACWPQSCCSDAQPRRWLYILCVVLCLSIYFLFPIKAWFMTPVTLIM